MKTIMLAVILAVATSTLTAEGPKVSEQNIVKLPVANDPAVNIRLWFKVGSQNDPQGKEGLASITAQMLGDASTTKLSYEQILEKLYPIASWYNASATAEMTIVAGRTHRDNIGEFYPLMIDAVLRPAFKQEDLDRIKSRALNYIENMLRYSSDEELGKAVLYTDIYKGTGYGHIVGGTVEGIKSITLDDIRAFYQTHFTRDNVVIGIGGAYTSAQLEQLREDLGKLPAGTPAVAAKPSPSLKGFSVTMVEKDAPATAISMGFPISATRGTKDWYALAVATSWLGEHRNSSSHLYQVIREERGLNYGDYAYIEHFPNAGGMMKPPQNVSRRQQLFEIWIRPVPNEARHFALRAALREYKQLVDRGMTQGEFELTKNFLRKYVLHYATTTMERLGYALDDRFYGVQGSHLEMFRKAMDQVTLADVNAAIKKHWQYGTMHIAIVTKDAAAFRDALASDAPSPITYKTPKPAEVLEADKEIQVFPLKIDPAQVKIVKVEDLFAR